MQVHPSRALRALCLWAIVLLSGSSHGVAHAGGIEFEGLEQARSGARVDSQPLVVIAGAAWCSACKEFREGALGSPKVLGIADDFRWSNFDIDRDVSLARQYSVRATPTILVIAPDGRVVSRAMGALSAMELTEFLLESKRLILTHPGENEGQDPYRVSTESQSALTWSPEGYRSRSICFSHVGYGPLNLPSQAPGQVLRLGIAPHTPSTLTKGQLEVGVTESLVNVFNYREDDFRLDYGTLNSVLSVAYGVTDTVLVEFEYSDLSRFDSILDPVTTAYHDLVGVGDAGREQFPEGDNALFLRGEGGNADINNTTTGSIARDFGLTVQHNLTCGTDILPAMSYALTARHHTGGKSDLIGNSPWSFGVSLAASRRFYDEFYAYAAVSYASHGMDRWNGIALKKTQLSGVFAMEWRFDPQVAFLLQYVLSEGVARERSPFNENAHEIGIGWKWEATRGTLWEFGLIENAVTADNSPDFGLHVGFKHRF
jgi:hypothetical protein